MTNALKNASKEYETITLEFATGDQEKVHRQLVTVPVEVAKALEIGRLVLDVDQRRKAIADFENAIRHEQGEIQKLRMQLTNVHGISHIEGLKYDQYEPAIMS